MDDASGSTVGIVVGVIATVVTSLVTLATLMFNARQQRLREERDRKWNLEDRRLRAEESSRDRQRQTKQIHAAIETVGDKADAAYHEANSMNTKIAALGLAVATGARPPVAAMGPVLIVDDDPSSVKLELLLLRQEGLDAQAVGTVAAARAAVAAIMPAVVLVDIMLVPAALGGSAFDLSGMRLARELHVLYPALPIVLCSSLPLSTEDVTDSGAIGAIWKPIETRTFGATVRSYALAEQDRDPGE